MTTNYALRPQTDLVAGRRWEAVFTRAVDVGVGVPCGFSNAHQDLNSLSNFDNALVLVFFFLVGNLVFLSVVNNYETFKLSISEEKLCSP